MVDSSLKRFERAVLLSVMICFNLHGQIQGNIVSDTLSEAPNLQLRADGLHRFLFGSSWRDLWAMPVTMSVVRISQNCISTITPHSPLNSSIRSLSFRGSDSICYTFTPFRQDSGSSLPDELSELLPEYVRKDQMGILHPFAPLISSILLKGVGLPYRTTSACVLVIDSMGTAPRGGILEGAWNGIPSSSVEPISTQALLDSLDSSIQVRVDELEYIKARIMDLFLGDWDRSEDSWQWYSLPIGSNRLWKPLPCAQFHALNRLNGLLPTIADIAIPQLEHCGETISSVENSTLTGRTLDRRILISHIRQTWDSLTASVQATSTDSILLEALAAVPHPNSTEQAEILEVLKSRRSQLPRAVREFYRLSSGFVDIHGSKNADRVGIHRIGRHMVNVEIFDRTDTTAVQRPTFSRLFTDDITQEIRVFLRGGDDLAVIDGEESSSISLVIDGGEGHNEILNRTKEKGLLTGRSTSLPGRISIYHFGDAMSASQTLESGTMRNSIQHLLRDWGSEWTFNPWLDLNPDDGLFLGGGPVYTRYAYQMAPWAEQMNVRVGLATRFMKYRLDATGEFRDWFQGIHIFIQLHASQLDLSNFFGVGNESSYNQSLYQAGFYKVDQQEIFAHGALDFPLMQFLSASLGATVKLIDNNPKPGTLLNALQLPLYNKTITYAILQARLTIDTRDQIAFPTSGWFGSGQFFYAPSILDNSKTFYKLHGEVRHVYTPTFLPLTTLAFRGIGEKIWGSYPFFESTFLGGNESLRGFERQRFAGDASLLGSTEIRAHVAKIPFLVPLWIGISGFIETGRVFLEGEGSIRWHHVIGGGLWFSFIKPEYVANFSLARSEDKFAFYATMGFMF